MLQGSLAHAPPLPKPACSSVRGPQQEKPLVRSRYAAAREKPLLATARESLHTAVKTQSCQKCTNKNKLKRTRMLRDLEMVVPSEVSQRKTNIT